MTKFASLLCLWCASLACTPESSASQRAAQRVRPYLDEFARFDRWARRAQTSELVLRDRNALSEAMFAPIRQRASVLAAFVELEEGNRRLRLAQPAKLERPAGLAWIALRDPALAGLRVALPAPCPAPLAPKPDASRSRACVLIERRASTPEQAVLTVTVAFAEP
jgi:hypothetical protein